MFRTGGEEVEMQVKHVTWHVWQLLLEVFNKHTFDEESRQYPGKQLPEQVLF